MLLLLLLLPLGDIVIVVEPGLSLQVRLGSPSGKKTQRNSWRNARPEVRHDRLLLLLLLLLLCSGRYMVSLSSWR